jgi:hypothetical protein
MLLIRNQELPFQFGDRHNTTNSPFRSEVKPAPWSRSVLKHG